MITEIKEIKPHNLPNKIFFILKLREVNIEGIELLLNYLEHNKFFDCPASTKYHGCFEGGLLEHSINVYLTLKDFNLKIPKRTLILTSLLHDICKINCYIKTDDKFIFNSVMNNRGHAKLSLERIKRFIILTDLEQEMIKYHMGIYGCVFWNKPEYTFADLIKAFNNVEVKALHLADEIATQFKDN